MEKVQLALERFLPELRDLEQRKIFDKEEIAAIVKQRRMHEQALVSRAVKPVDYLRYIEYENSLERLRLKRLLRSDRKGKGKRKRTLSDHSIQQHITTLHRLASTRFPESTVVWDAYIHHALQGDSPLLVSRVLSQAIALHPLHAQYWLTAARWEAKGNEKGIGGGNMDAARKLVMRALRFLKRTNHEQDIWLEWIRLEIAFVDQLAQRWQLLGIVKANPAYEAVAIPETADQSESAAEASLNKQTSTAGQDAVLEGAIVSTVLTNALESLSHALTFYARVLPVLRRSTVDHPVLRQKVLSQTYDALATAHLASNAAKKDVMAVELYCQGPLLDLLTLHDVDIVTEASKPKARKNGMWNDRELAPALLESLVSSIERWSKILSFDPDATVDTSRRAESSTESAETWDAFLSWLDEGILPHLRESSATEEEEEEASAVKSDILAYVESVHEAARRARPSPSSS